MPVITEATAQARLIAKRGANVAAVLIGASFHPFRTVRGGASVVRGLVNPGESTAAPAPTDAQQTAPSAAPAETTTKAPTTKSATKAATKKAATKTAPKDAPATKAPAKKAPAKKAAPGPTTVAKPVAPPEPVVDAGPDADRPVEPRGPVPHIPPSIAGEVERDYGDDLPGITPAGD